jgi:hypothetical protein
MLQTAKTARRLRRSDDLATEPAEEEEID